MSILITGGAGYIGSITNKYLREQGLDTVVFDNLSQGHREAVLEAPLVVGNLSSEFDIERVFREYYIEGVIHFAASAFAGESMRQPEDYYHNNITNGINLLKVMRRNNCKKIVFSSTCAVYGFPEEVPVNEKALKQPVSIYGSSKKIFEEILAEFAEHYDFKIGILRYFNAAGASLDGKIGEDHRPETHIIPNLLKAAYHELPFNLYGDDYQTEDGTCVRDYIHVLDLARAHLLAYEKLDENDGFIYNLGNERGYSNLELLKKVEEVTGKHIDYEVKERRKGDPDAIWADSSLALKELRWKTEFSDLDTIVGSAWEWYLRHPHGYLNS